MPRERGSSCFFAMLGEPSLELRSDCADVATLNAVSAYLPRSLISHLSSGQVQVPERHRCKAALAFVDVSGFTKLSLALEKEHGPEGAEKLQLFINSYFHRLIRSVLFHGGDILKFAGDAFLVMWRAREDDDEDDDDEDSFVRGERQLREVTAQAVRCCLSILCDCDHFEPAPGVPLRLHSGVAAGELDVFVLGEQELGLEYLVAGPVVDAMGVATDESEAGEVCLAAQVRCLPPPPSGRDAPLFTSPPPPGGGTGASACSGTGARRAGSAAA